MQRLILWFAICLTSYLYAARETAGTKAVSPHSQTSTAEPRFSAFFDLLLLNQPGGAEFSFVNFHPLLFFEILPNAETQFTFEVRPNPRYFELDYQITPTIQIRAGKIWIPFDDMTPHSIFGGRIGGYRMRLSDTANKSADYFLPDIWSDLGVGAKINVSETSQLTSDAYVYVVNGFSQSDAAGANPARPNFVGTDVTSVDNNSDKAMGGRLHMLFARVFGVGASAYIQRWNSQTLPDVDPLSLTMLGVDVSLRIDKITVKVGSINMSVQTSADAKYARKGTYIEVIQKITDQIRLIFRGGEIDTDDRVVDANDVTVVGGGVAYRTGVLQLSFDYQVDINPLPTKKGTTFTAVRLAIQM